MRKRKWLHAMLALVLVVLAGCSSGPNAGGGSAQDGASGGGTTGARAPSSNGSAAPMPAPGSEQGAEAPADPPGDIPSVANRKIIYHAETDLQVKNADDAFAQIKATVQKAGGFVENSTMRGLKPDARTLTIKLRVPAARYRAVLDSLSELGEQGNLSEWTEDVTAEYVDVNIRIETREAHLARLKQLAAQAGTIRELMELEQEIARVTADLESLKGRLRVLNDQIDLSTITVRIYEPAAPRPVQEPKTVWERARNGFVDSFNGTINFLGDLFVFAITSIPKMILLAVFAVAVFGGIRLLEKRRRPPSPPAQPPGNG